MLRGQDAAQVGLVERLRVRAKAHLAFTRLAGPPADHDARGRDALQIRAAREQRPALGCAGKGGQNEKGTTPRGLEDASRCGVLIRNIHCNAGQSLHDTRVYANERWGSINQNRGTQGAEKRINSAQTGFHHSNLLHACASQVWLRPVQCASCSGVGCPPKVNSAMCSKSTMCQRSPSTARSVVLGSLKRTVSWCKTGISRPVLKTSRKRLNGSDGRPAKCLSRSGREPTPRGCTTQGGRVSGGPGQSHGDT